MEQKMLNKDELKNAGKRVATWDGVSRDVYLVDIANLHYNSDNGRIASWISGYKNDSNKPLLDSLSLEEYNNTLEFFVLHSGSRDIYKRTKENIAEIGQTEPGVILENGLIVSGNRRFTCLRSLFQETSNDKFRYFLCFVLPVPNSEASRQEIKRIEKVTQDKVVEQEAYQAVERLVDIYNVLIGPNKLWTKKEYKKLFNPKNPGVDDLYNRAMVMIEYLEFIGKPLRFDIVRIEKLDGPINEIANKIYKSTAGTAEWNRIKGLIFHWMQTCGGDRTRRVRDLLNNYKKNPQAFEAALSSYNKDINQSEEESILIERNKSYSSSISSLTEQEKNEIGITKSPISEETERIINKGIQTTKVSEARKKPIKNAESASQLLSEMDLGIVEHYDQKEKNELTKIFSDIQKIIGRILKKLN